MKTITITEEQAKQYELPAKAVGDWSIVEKGDGYGLLHRLKKDGALGSDRPNNKIKIELEVLNKLSASMTIPNDFKWTDKTLNNSLPKEEKEKFIKQNDINIRQPIGEAVPTTIFQQIAQNIKKYIK